jgi:hypothetical protein
MRTENLHVTVMRCTYRRPFCVQQVFQGEPYEKKRLCSLYYIYNSNVLQKKIDKV